MSPRAAWRLETLGFEQVYDYAAGKADWGAAGLPREGTVASDPSAGDAADPDVPTCSLQDDLRSVPCACARERLGSVHRRQRAAHRARPPWTEGARRRRPAL